MRFPQLGTRNVFDAVRPCARVTRPLDPIFADALLVHASQQRRDPRSRMNAVRHRSDRHFIRLLVGPHLLPKGARDFAMFATDAVSRSAHAQSQRCEAKRIRLLAVYAAKPEKLFA